MYAQRDDLHQSLYDELRKLASARLRRLQPSQTFQTTDLVHETYLRLMKNQPTAWNGRRHFFGAAAMAMRDILVDHIRYKQALKRGGDHVRVDLDDVTYQLANNEATLSAPELLTLHEALEQLQKIEPKYSEVIMLRYFAGLSMDEIAEMLGVTKRTIERYWRATRAWLRTHLEH